MKMISAKGIVKKAITLSAVLFLAGCQTPYQEMGGTGGVTAAPITNDTYRISAPGNGYTDPTAIQDYALLKAAEVTLQSGNTHFIIVDGKDATSRNVGQTLGTFQTNMIGNTAFTTYNPGISYDIVKPGQDVIVQTFSVSAGAAPPPGAMNAQQVYDNINPRVLRPKPKTTS
jgi:hypothetical protein